MVPNISSKIHNCTAERQIAVFTVSAIVCFTNMSPFDVILTQLIQSLILTVNFSKVSSLITDGLRVVYFLSLLYRSADKSLARPARKQATTTENFDFHISYL